MIGQTLGHYRILEKIGDGGMGEVFRARDDRLGRDVALKIIRRELAGDNDRVRRFEQEARAAAALNHPNIVAIYDIGVHHGSPYIVSELLEGQTLRQRLFEGALPPRSAADLGLQIAQALIAAHDKYIVHRDLKPENLFLTRDSRVKVLDFGIAKLIPPEHAKSEEAMRTTQTRSGSVLGTVSYMSPEQLRGRAVDHRSDIFSFGAILYEMLSGRRAFRGDTEVDTMTAVLKEDPLQLSEIRPNVPAAFEPLVSHCLEKDPDQRFQSARDLAFALSTVSALSTSKALLAIRIGKWRSRLMRWSVAAVVLATITGLWLGSRLWRSSVSPVYRRLTFERGTIYSARFAPDGASVIYGASWNGQPLKLYSTLADSPLEHPLSFIDAHLLAVSRTNELALALGGIRGSHLEIINGTLARAPLEGGAPREVRSDVRWADWDARNELAVVHYENGTSRLEYPLGHVLYQSSGWITDIKISPQNDKIAFFDHPALWDDRGSVCTVDLSGHKTTFPPEWGSGDGLAWSPRGDEIWFTATESGYNRALWAVNLSGRKRQILVVPGGLTLEDIARDGRVLIAFQSERLAMEVAGNHDPPRDLSWYDWTIAKDISSDGLLVLFEEASQPAGPNYWVAIRKLDASPPVLLGEGSAGGFSPDQKWVLALFTGAPEHLALLPTGAGETRNISPRGVEHLQNGWAGFLPGGKRIIFSANQPGHQMRSYLLDISGGDPVPVTPEGITAILVSPDEKYLAGQDASQRMMLYPIPGGEPRPIPGLDAGDLAAQWSSDGSALYVYRRNDIPLRVYRVDLRTGKKQLAKELSPDRAGVVRIGPLVMTRDASTFVYSYYQALSVLYVVSGLK